MSAWMTNEKIETATHIYTKGEDGNWYSRPKQAPEAPFPKWPLWIMFLIAVKVVHYLLTYG